MNNKALKTLEYNKITDRLASHASSEPGIKLCRELQPMMDMDEINSALKQTSDAVSRIFRHGSISFAGLKDIRPLTKALEVGSALGMSELLDICSLLKVAAGTRRYGVSEDEAADSLSGMFNVIYDIADVRREIERCILSEDEIADDASAELKNIRRQMRICTERIRTELNSMLNGSDRTYLQEAVITTRGGRYCIPVKAEYKSQVPGMVHDQSKAGSTFFIEPMSVVRLNNEIREYEVKESEEIAKILASLSAMAGNYTAELDADYDILSQLDFIFAKAKLSFEYKGSEPIMNTRGYINIRKGRHPLIDSRKVVPIDVSIGDEYSELIITGPNTGGKTVTLKTIGLFSLLGQSGLHIPAADNSELTVFNDIFADIGDEQSIEQNLSTFSAHMTNTISILEHADENSLCLFDELGAGTDPTEGAALAIAILKHLHDRSIRTMATTHYSELKVFALTTSYVENACCEFDVETLRPTYRLLIGIPGKSNAFAISSKLGLSNEIIESAKQHISEEDESFEDLLADLENSRKTIEKERAEIESYKQEISSLKDKLTQKQERLDAQKDRILKEANEEARQILQDAKDVADETIRNFQKYNTGTSMKEMEKARTKVRDKISEKNSKISQQAANPTHKILKPSQIKPGDMVKVVSMGLKGTVSSMPDAKGDMFVQCGIIRSKVNIKDLVLINEDAMPNNPYKKQTARTTRSNTSRIGASKTSTFSMEINLLGKTVDEAISELDKYLDDAYLSHAPSVRIVHGKGTGALRAAVQRYLKSVSYVKSFHLGEYGEGDAGVTIAEFK